MNVIGIVTEYNPFHSGHAWQIAESCRQLGADSAVVCVMSGNWVQRGDCAILDKWQRAAMALAGGADLILDLPTPWATASAEFFAQGAVSLLSATGIVTHLSFGSESGLLPQLQAVASCLNSQAYHQQLKQALTGGISFASARQQAVTALLGDGAQLLSSPNNNLAVEYLRCLPPHFTPITVQRAGAGHDQAPSQGHASASWIRQQLRSDNSKITLDYLPTSPKGELASLTHVERGILAQLRRMDLAEAMALPDSEVGLCNRLLTASGQASTLEELYDLTKTKRYAHARIRRLVLSAFLGLKQSHRQGLPSYLRVLGMSNRGQMLLKQMAETATLPLIIKPGNVRSMDSEVQAAFGLECHCTDLYQLCKPTIGQSGQEWRTSPVIFRESENIPCSSAP